MTLFQNSNAVYIDTHHAILFLIIGLFVGFLSGLLGKGGSAITTPALQVFGGVTPFLALASPLPSSLSNTISGSIAYKKEKLLNRRVILISLISGVPATVGGSLLSPMVGGRLLMILTAFFVCTLGLSFILPRVISFPHRMSVHETVRPDTWKIIVVAVMVGGLSGLLANSGGVLLAPLFIRWLKLPIKQALASSLLIAGGLALPGTITHWILGHIDWWIVLWLTLGSVPSAYFGAKVAIRLRNDLLELIFGLMLCIFGFYDIYFTLIH